MKQHTESDTHCTPGNPDSYECDGKSDNDNHSNQENPNNDEYDK